MCRAQRFEVEFLLQTLRPDVKLFSRQNGLVLLEIFFHGRLGTDGIGRSDGVGLGQFVMHQQFADESNLQVQLRHAPDLAGFQRLQTGTASQLDVPHARVCAETMDLTS
jgi:hypothetical protein